MNGLRGDFTPFSFFGTEFSCLGGGRACASLLTRSRKPRPWVQRVGNKLRGKPLLDMVGAVVDDYDYLWDEYYFSTSTM